MSLVDTTTFTLAAQSTEPAVIGSGAVGWSDGAAGSSTFVEPVGIVSDGRGGLLVADAGAQRIRSIDPAGNVRTIAGSGEPGGLNLAVAGGYENGPAALARFNHPTSLAIRSDGGVLIADDRNHVIRLLKDGRVTLFAGSPTDESGRDGPRGIGSLSYPRSIAIAANGTAYVADWSKGLRSVTPSGVIATIPLPAVMGLNVLSVTVAGDAADQRLVITNGIQTLAFDLVSHATGFYSNDPNDRLDGAPGDVEGAHGTGNPVALSAISPVEFLYSDTERDGVHYMHGRFDDTLDVPTGLSFESPTGIAVLPDDRVAVADTGHRRVVILPALDRRAGIFGVTFPPPIPANTYRVGVLGNSYVFYNVRYADSIEAQLERELTSENGRAFQVVPMRFGPISGMKTYIKEVLSAGLTDAVVLVVDSNLIYQSYAVPYWSDLSASRAVWEPNFERDLREMSSSLSDAGIPLSIIIHPVANEVGPAERIAGFEREGKGVDAASLGGSEAALATVVGRLGLPCTLDMEDRFVAAERAVPHEDLFGSADFHFTARGNALMADGIKTMLRRCAPWKSGAMPR